MPKVKYLSLNMNGNEVRIKMMKHHFSKRMNLSISQGQIKLIVPTYTPWYIAEKFLKESTDWLINNLPEQLVIRRQPSAIEKKEARLLVIEKIDQWQSFFDKSPNNIRIGNQSSRWGSCSSKGTLSFNWRLIELPSQLVDYVIVHELAHLIQPNHSPKFWGLVESAIPDYKARRKRMKNYRLHD